MNKTHPSFKRPEESVNEICPRCHEICNYGFENKETPEWCGKCGYDLRFKINPIQNLFHKIFWGKDAWRYPLAYCKKAADELDELKKINDLVR
jgi:hypothetical protein